MTVTENLHQAFLEPAGVMGFGERSDQRRGRSE
jgi:hypothetical protein